MGLAALRQAAERTQVELARVYRCDLRPVCQVSSAVDPLLPVAARGREARKRHRANTVGFEPRTAVPSLPLRSA